MRGTIAVVVGLIGCAGDEGPAKESAEEAARRCVAGLEGEPRTEILQGGVLVEDGAEVPLDFAPQGGLYTPFRARVWGHPELYGESPMEGVGTLWAGWSLVDVADGTVLAENAGTWFTSCVEADGGSYLDLEFHAQYEDPSGDIWAPDVDWFDGRVADLVLELAPPPEPGEAVVTSAGGVSREPTVEVTSVTEREVVLFYPYR